MSNTNTPTSGYVVSIEVFKNLLSLENQKILADILEKMSKGKLYLQDVEEFLVNNVVIEVPFSLYLSSEEDDLDYDVMLPDNVYVQFDEGDLFTKEPTNLYKKLCENNVKPEYCSWPVWS